ncbi:MSMEG_4193 family putative phosphomutase [Nocardioides marmorisolisilvae]|uniref:MSMEG_4193 family putative phosphomutase n=1 Tax=Nocardioides marmorisolisilvae TaxID=1542737 RepID=A0A3N0DUV0_9ACTN|nr:MSMEG_4193 family putative phosphomutase [Nocardioides marmorisolisilvae]RNL79368.1 MSMEG_4193 family putative phosphomutase [Nocardioides marmorisolisilvae]
MATVILARHGRTSANATGVLAGRTPGIALDDVGTAQATAAAARLEGLTLAAAFTSPLDRCKETAKLLLNGTGLRARVERGLNECDYGDWSGRPMKELVKEDLWKVIQAHPAGVEFPGGESMATMSARSVSAVRACDAAVAAEHGDGAVWLAVAHGDIIKAVLADALGMHLDAFQRIVVDPGSLSVIRYTPKRSFVLAMNTQEGSLTHLATQREKPDEKLGGGAGPGRT